VESISNYISVIRPGCANIMIDSSLYDPEAIHAATYAFTSNYTVIATRKSDTTILVIFEEIDASAQLDIQKDMKELMTAVIDHQLRLQLDRANGKIRELIVAHAFSPLDLHKEAKCL
jgi:His-Xaa-Ser system protein HxsD